MAWLPHDAFIGLYVKVKLIDPNSSLTEHVWISCDGTKDTKLTGVVDNVVPDDLGGMVTGNSGWLANVPGYRPTLGAALSVLRPLHTFDVGQLG